jgi:hypothetical protein
MVTAVSLITSYRPEDHHTMRSRFASSTALGVTFALALSIAGSIVGAAAPAFAAVPDLTAPAHAETRSFMFQPDVRVNYLSKTSLGGGKVAYRFRVQNIGAATASNVGLGNGISQHAIGQNLATLQQGSSGTIAFLGQDQSKEITVTCTPLPGYYCNGASLQAYITDDLNPANNKASGN